MKKIYHFEKLDKKSEELYRLLFYVTGTPMVVIEENSVITLANMEFEKLSGFSMAEIEYKKSIFDFIMKDDLFKVKKYHELRRSRPDLVPNSYEVRIVDRSGNSKSIIIKLAMIPGTEKSVASFIDITDEKAAKEELLNTRQKLWSILEFLADATFVVDQDRRIIIWNRSIEDMTGLMCNAIGGGVMVWDKDLHLIEENKFAKEIQNLIGESNENLLSTELTRRNEFLEQIVQTAGVIILVLDSEGKILRLNRFGEQLTGFLEKEIVGKDWLDTLIPERERVIYAGKMKEVKDKGYATGENFVLSRDNREILVRWNGSVLNSSIYGEQAFLAVGHDISELRTVEAQLLQAQKMEAVGRLAGGIAHDFNNILTGILGNVSSILTNISPDCGYFESLKEVKDSALMAADIVEKLLGFSRKSLMKSAVVNINDNIQEAYNIIKHTIDPRIAIKTSLDENLWLAAADKTQIVQILINLCLNAQDAMAEGGTIIIKTENVTIGESCLKNQPTYVRAGDFIKISVIDTGCGMPLEVQEQIFEPFFTTKKTGHGSGLGLSMVYGIVKQLAGWIDCRSEIGNGTIFTIHLPRAVYSVVPDWRNNVPDRKVLMSGNKTVLVVEDNRIVKNFIKRILLRNGFKSIIAGDGQEAIDFYREGWENIDLVVLDMTMPKLSGKDALILMKEINPSIKVLLISGYLFSNSEDPLLAKCQFLHKPFTENDLLQQLENLLYAND